MTTASFSPNKTQFYTANGFGRDSYIHGNNGGFVPQKKAVQCEALGKFFCSLFLLVFCVSHFMRFCC
jgi:hypothetical protein